MKPLMCTGRVCVRVQRAGEQGWQGLRSKQEECRYHSSNYCFINGPRVAVNEELHQSVLTARCLGRHSRSRPQSVDFNLAQKLIIRFSRNLVNVLQEGGQQQQQQPADTQTHTAHCCTLPHAASHTYTPFANC